MESPEQTHTAIYPGTFDPLTNGHIDIIVRALRLFQNVIVAVSPNLRKSPLFSLDERLEMIRDATKEMSNLSVESFDGLLVSYVRKKKATAIIRGIRAVSDFEYEFQMALMNRKLDLNVETIYLMPSQDYCYLSSSLIKEVAGLGGDIADLVPKVVSLKLAQMHEVNSE